jgi:hypothetical protein
MRLAFAFALLCTPAFANIEVEFIEGAPKDRFVLTNTGECALVDTQITIDLTDSASGIIFDTTERGAGVEVFQPLQIVAGQQVLARVPVVTDGDTRVAFDITTLPADQSLVFTIDVDDTDGGREITVSDAEIQGAKVFVTGATGEAVGVFDGEATARVKTEGCIS